MPRACAIGLALLAITFSLRVLGQALVAFIGVDFLPPMREWYSGLIPYSVLLPIQLVILGLQAKISADIWRGAGRFATCRPGGGRVIIAISVVYFLAMVVRYALTMYLHPERRWLRGAIPIIFHGVLAAYLFLLGNYYASAQGATQAAS
jgi:hypothetical protein